MTITAPRRRAPTGRTVLLDWLPVFVWAGLIFWFSSQPNLRFTAEDWLDFVVRKSGHLFVFGVLAILLWRALADARLPRAAFWAWLGAGLYAVTDELHQSLTAGRHPSPVDVGIDCAGALIGLSVVAAVGRLRRRWAGTD